MIFKMVSSKNKAYYLVPICRQEIIVFFAIDIPDLGINTLVEYNRKGVIVMCSILVFESHALFSGTLFGNDSRRPKSTDSLEPLAGADLVVKGFGKHIGRSRIECLRGLGGNKLWSSSQHIIMSFGFLRPCNRDDDDDTGRPSRAKTTSAFAGFAISQSHRVSTNHLRGPNDVTSSGPVIKVYSELRYSITFELVKLLIILTWWIQDNGAIAKGAPAPRKSLALNLLLR
jgi:hypothetical protein